MSYDGTGKAPGRLLGEARILARNGIKLSQTAKADKYKLQIAMLFMLQALKISFIGHLMHAGLLPDAWEENENLSFFKLTIMVEENLHIIQDQAQGKLLVSLNNTRNAIAHPDIPGGLSLFDTERDCRLLAQNLKSLWPRLFNEAYTAQATRKTAPRQSAPPQRPASATQSQPKSPGLKPAVSGNKALVIIAIVIAAMIVVFYACLIIPRFVIQLLTGDMPSAMLIHLIATVVH